MALFYSFPISPKQKIKILIAGKKELPFTNLNVDEQKNEISKLTGFHESKIFILNQVHEDGIVDLGMLKNFSFPKGDAWIGEESNQILCIKTADCMPLFFGPLKALSL